MFSLEWIQVILEWIREFFSDISWPTWAGLFVCYFFLNVLYTKNALYTYRLKALASANTGVLLYILGYLGIATFIDNNNNIVPIVISSWLAEYFTIVWEIKKCNNEQKDSKNKKTR